jgi:hypothetical protein
MGVLIFPVFPELGTRTEYRPEKVGNPNLPNEPKTGVQSQTSAAFYGYFVFVFNLLCSKRSFWPFCCFWDMGQNKRQRKSNKDIGDRMILELIPKPSLRG